MIPLAFDYVRVGSVDEALASLAEHGEEAKVLAGGHSLLPLMKLRLATPAVLVDLGPVAELSFVRDGGDHVAVGAMTRHRDLQTDPLLAAHAPLVGVAAGHIGDPQVRHRGTIGGSIAHGDPASDLPAVLLALRASLVVRGPAGERTVAVDDFFTGFLETAVGPEELLTEIRIPKATGAGFSFQKFARRAHDWAIVGVSLVTGDRPGVGLVNMGSVPLRAAAVEAAVASGASAAEAAEAAIEGTEPTADLNASVEYRRHLVRVLTRRALEEAAA